MTTIFQLQVLTKILIEEYLGMVKEYVQNNEKIKELQTKIREK